MKLALMEKSKLMGIGITVRNMAHKFLQKIGVQIIPDYQIQSGEIKMVELVHILYDEERNIKPLSTILIANDSRNVGLVIGELPPDGEFKRHLFFKDTVDDDDLNSVLKHRKRS